MPFWQHFPLGKKYGSYSAKQQCNNVLGISEIGRCHSHLAFSEKGNWEPLWNKGFTLVGATTQKTRHMARFEYMVNHVAQGIFRGGGMCAKYQAMRSRWLSSACVRGAVRNTAEMETEKQLRVKDTGELWFWKLWGGFSEGQSSVGTVSKSTAENQFCSFVL